MDKFFKILDRVEIELPMGLILGTSTKVGQQGYKDFDINKVSNNCEYILNNRSYRSMPAGTIFDVVFSKNNPQSYVKIDARLKEIYIKRGEKVDVLPENMHGECLLEFVNGKKPELLSKLALWEEEYDPEKNDFLYFTTQQVMDKIIELLG